MGGPARWLVPSLVAAVGAALAAASFLPCRYLTIAGTRHRPRLLPDNPDIAAAVANSASGLELATGGFTEDVAIATELDTCAAVPVLSDEAFSPTA